MEKQELQEFCDIYGIKYTKKTSETKLVDKINEFKREGPLLLSYIDFMVAQKHPAHPALTYIRILPFYSPPRFLPNIGDMKVIELKEILRIYGLDLGGVKSEMVARINKLFDLSHPESITALRRLCERYINFAYFSGIEEFELVHQFPEFRVQNIRDEIDYHRREIERLQIELEQELKPRTIEGHIYVIGFGAQCKIGKTKYKSTEALRSYLHRRYHTPYGFKELNDENLKYVASYNLAEDERNYHMKYAAYRQNGSEVFNISFKDVCL